jgi:hypothetical protein
VTVADVKACLKKYLTKLFQTSSSAGVVSSATAKVQDIEAGFRRLGYEVEIMTLDSDE